ncbi:hypothetical protein [Candidatus Mycoplasma haematominutum]|uniref:hypothetical protein n=1 Tax=Candidatus Mycoplasma haematominutum TaxID=209446 RepID=UPI0002F15CA2|nr:hypothetical protein [Candidatus Mycoplasma haematominutum]
MEKLVEHSSFLSSIYESVSQHKEDYMQALQWISSKAGGYKQLLKYALQESNLLLTQLEKLRENWSTISSKLGNMVKKLNEKKSDIEEISKDLEWTNFTSEGEAWSKLKTNLGDYLTSLVEESDQLDSWITTLKQQKDKLKKLVSDSGSSISTWLEKKSELSRALDLDSTGGLKFSDVVNNLKELKDDSFKNLENVQQKMVAQPQAAKILIKSAGKGWTGFVKIVNNWSKYEALLNSTSSR